MNARTFSLEPETIISKPAAKYPVTVHFAGTALVGLLEGDMAWVAMRPIVEGMGLDWKAQYDKIKEDEVLASVVGQKTMTGADGKRYKMVCLPEDYLQGWLFTVNPKKVKPELREKIVQYKRQCYQVLHTAFTARSNLWHPAPDCSKIGESTWKGCSATLLLPSISVESRVCNYFQYENLIYFGAVVD